MINCACIKPRLGLSLAVLLCSKPRLGSSLAFLLCSKPRLGLSLVVVLCSKPRLGLSLVVVLCSKPRLGLSLVVVLCIKPRLGLSLETCNSARTRVTYTKCGCIFQCLVTWHFFVSKQKETWPASSGFSFCPFVCIGFNTWRFWTYSLTDRSFFIVILSLSEHPELLFIQFCTKRFPFTWIRLMNRAACREFPSFNFWRAPRQQ